MSDTTALLEAVYAESSATRAPGKTFSDAKNTMAPFPPRNCGRNARAVRYAVVALIAN
jgi:hypothetical protein